MLNHYMTSQHESLTNGTHEVHAKRNSQNDDIQRPGADSKSNLRAINGEQKVQGGVVAAANGAPSLQENALPSAARPGLSRAKSDVGPRWAEHSQNGDSGSRDAGKDEWKIRHGWEAQLTLENYLNHLNNV